TFSFAFFLLSVTCSLNHPSYPYHLVNHSWVYCIKQHNDSLYFSTLEEGIFRFHPDNPDAIARVGRCRTLPFRSIVFPPDGRLLASSYYSGVFAAGRDTLLPVKNAPYAAWSMKLDKSGSFWLAGTRGVMRQAGDTVVVFKNVTDARDVALFGKAVAVAHMRGVTLYDRESGALSADYCRDVVCWTLAVFDSVLVAGGSNVCAVIGAHACRLIRVPPQGNMPWSIERDSLGAIFMGTQKGLFRAGPNDSEARCVGLEGKCVKSVLFDRSGRLWVGTFYR
ncbi:MAG TPA: two-component regulator propeller domain-containing protein, partial [Chitinivibrionales bacterium]|nr:two-component regulator propeller domain-containing protein [Chitinivibrionales bacterium]